MKFQTVLIFACCCLYLASARIIPRNLLRLYTNSLKRNPSQIIRPASLFSTNTPHLSQTNGGWSIPNNLFSQFVVPKKTESGKIPVPQSAIKNVGPFSRANPFAATMKVNRELYKAQGLYRASSIMHVEFDIEGSNIEYKTGDHVGVYLKNDPELVELVGSILNADLDTEFSPDNSNMFSIQRKAPSSITYRDFLTNYIELTSIPAHQLVHLSQYCSDENDRESMVRMANVDGHQSVVNLNLLPLLESLKSFRPPIDVICNVMVKRSPNFYPITSSPSLYPNTIHIAIEQEQFLFKKDGFNKGATALLSAQSLATQVPIFVQSRQVSLPSNLPILMIGAAKGLAPFRAIIQERDNLRRSGQTVGDTVLFFGARNPKEFIYRDEFMGYAESGSLTLRGTLAEDQPEEFSVMYRLAMNSDLVWNVIKNNGRIFISETTTKTTFREEVAQALRDVLVTKGNMEEDSAMELLEKMVEEKKLIFDIFYWD